jgi:hypothetical protein
VAKLILTDAYISVNGTAISDHASAVTVEQTAEDVDLTSFGPSGYREFGTGFKDATINTTVFTDFSSGSIDAMIYPIYASNGTCSVVVKPTSSTTSATNPSYTLAPARINAYNPIAGGVGDASTTELVFRNAGTAGVVRGTS